MVSCEISQLLHYIDRNYCIHNTWIVVKIINEKNAFSAHHVFLE